MAKIYYNPSEDELIPVEEPVPRRTRRACSGWKAETVRCLLIILASIILLAILGGCLWGFIWFLFEWPDFIFIGLAIAALFVYHIVVVRIIDPDFIIM